jgi:hypothetical protein
MDDVINQYFSVEVKVFIIGDLIVYFINSTLTPFVSTKKKKQALLYLIETSFFRKK